MQYDLNDPNTQTRTESERLDALNAVSYHSFLTFLVIVACVHFTTLHTSPYM